PLPPYTQADAESMIEALQQNAGETRMPPAAAARLIEFAGGHSGLLAALFLEFNPHFELPIQRFLQRIDESEPVRQACAKIWLHLHSEEQGALRALAANQAIDPDMAIFLSKRGLVKRDNHLSIFSSIFRDYVTHLA
ncbi:MAG: hypothetical protein M3Q45_06590, partial [Chloroflexota bacterium]|nr:hypothetical protein [Chloroflexota bacterium]